MTVYEGWLADHAGHPLGPGMPTGGTIRGAEGGSHLGGWAAIVRLDPCVYCGAAGGTLDHVEPKNPLRELAGRAVNPCLPVAWQGGRHSWLNYAGCCDRCNSRKSDRPLLWWLATRSNGAGP